MKLSVDGVDFAWDDPELIDKLRAELAHVKAKSEERKMALEMIEPYETFMWCPWCRRTEYNTREHASFCPRQKALED